MIQLHLDLYWPPQEQPLAAKEPVDEPPAEVVESIAIHAAETASTPAPIVLDASPDIAAAHMDMG